MSGHQNSLFYIQFLCTQSSSIPTTHSWGPYVSLPFHFLLPVALPPSLRPSAPPSLSGEIHGGARSSCPRARRRQTAARRSPSLPPPSSSKRRRGSLHPCQRPPSLLAASSGAVPSSLELGPSPAPLPPPSSSGILAAPAELRGSSSTGPWRSAGSCGSPA